MSTKALKNLIDDVMQGAIPSRDEQEAAARELNAIKEAAQALQLVRFCRRYEQERSEFRMLPDGSNR